MTEVSQLMNKKIKQLLTLQEVKKTEKLYRARCPFCNNMTLIVSETKGHCYICGNERLIEELMILAEQDWLEKHGTTAKQMANNKGVKYSD